MSLHRLCMRNGSVVPDLYGAGEVTWQSGGYSQSVCFGKIAGRNAANAIAEESAAA